MSFVQTSGRQLLDNVSGTTTLHMPGNFAAGNSAIVVIAAATQGADLAAGAVVVNGVTATQVISSTPAGPFFGYDLYAQIWIAQGLPGGADSLTITVATTAAFLTAACIEWSQLVNPATDQAVQGSSGSTLTPSATTGTLAQADELIVAGFADATGVLVTSITDPGGWTNIFQELDGTVHTVGDFVYEVVAATTAVTASWVIVDSSGAQPLSAAIAAFKILGAAGLLGWGVGSFPLAPPRSRKNFPDNWDPLPGLTAVQAATPSTFSPPPSPRPRRPQVPDNSAVWAPLVPPSVGWGFSQGQYYSAGTPLPIAWEPLASLPQQSAAGFVFSAAPLGAPMPRRYPIAWEPLASLPLATVPTGEVARPKRARAQVDQWSPLPALPAVLAPTTVPTGEVARPKRARAQVDQWSPLPALPAVLAPTTVPTGEVARPKRARAQVDQWSPLPALPAVLAPTTVPTGEVQRPKRARAQVDQWSPLPGLPTPAPLGAAPSSSPPAKPQALRRAPESTWEPVPSLPVPSGAFSQAPAARRRAVTSLPNWEPLPRLSAPAASFSASPVPSKRRRIPVDGWQPLAQVVVLPTIPSGFECPAPLPIRSHRAAVPENWTPLGDLIPPIPQTNQPYLLAAV